MRIGFLGLGNMGRAMASNLIRAGHEVVVYNRTRSTAAGLAAEGARIADSPAEAAGQEIVVTMLANDNAVESVVLGAHGVLDGMQRDGLHVSMSTISPALSQRLSAAHKERRQQYIAAPVFGRPEAAAAAKLFIVASGAKESLAKAKPIFEALGQRTFTVGERPEDANYVKLFGNFMLTCVMESRTPRDQICGGLPVLGAVVASCIAAWTLLLPAFMLLVLAPFERARISDA